MKCDVVFVGDSSGLVSPVFRTQPYEIGKPTRGLGYRAKSNILIFLVFEQQTSSQASETRLLAGATPQESLDGRKNDNRKRKDAAQGGASKFETNFVKRNIEVLDSASHLSLLSPSFLFPPHPPTYPLLRLSSPILPSFPLLPVILHLIPC